MPHFFKHSKQLMVSSLLVALPSVTLAASPWLPAPQSGNVSISYIYSTADEFFAGQNKLQLPTDLEQHNALFSLEYGINDRFAVDLSLGYARTEFLEDPVLSPSSSLDGLIDPRLGLRYKVWDELEDGGVTFTLRGGITIGGGYDQGALNSIGDDAFAAEISGIIGKTWENGFGISGEVGFRYREDDVPDEFFSNVDTFYSLAPLLNIPLTINFNYQVIDALSGIDIGSPGFSPRRFPETEEDYHLASGGLSYSLMPGLSVNANYGVKVFDRRNTAESEVVSVGLSYSF